MRQEPKKINERKILYKICEQAEKEFGVICYAYKEGLLWYICIDDYDKYLSKDFKDFSTTWHKRIKSSGLDILFCYCYPSEDRLYALSQEDNLILNT